MAKIHDIEIKLVCNGEMLTAAKMNQMIESINRLKIATSLGTKESSSLPVAAVTAGLLMAGNARRRVTRRGLLGLGRLLGHGQA